VTDTSDNLARFVDDLIRDVATEAKTCYAQHQRRGTYPSTVTNGLARSTAALANALPEHRRELARGYVGANRPDSPVDPLIVADNISRMIITFGADEPRRHVSSVGLINDWIGTKIRLSALVTEIKATGMYVWHKAAEPSPHGIAYGVEGVYLGWAGTPTDPTLYLADDDEVMAVRLRLPAIAGLYVAVPIVRTMPLR
jgi:hypothetical protein